MNKRTLTLAAAALLGGLAMSAGSASAAPLSVNTVQSDPSLVSTVQMTRMERRMMERRMMKRRMMERRMDRRMDRRRMMDRRMDRRMMNRM